MSVWYLMLFVMGSAVALGLSEIYELETPAIAAGVVLGLPAVYLAWAAFRADRAEASALDEDTAAVELAKAVTNWLNEEARFRRIYESQPLPVVWRAADEDLIEDWPDVAGLARSWPGGGPGDQAHWARDAAGLSGQDAEIGDVFLKKVPTRRLVILGEPGGGKSVLLVRLLADLMGRRSDGDPVPVLFSLASWNPRHPLKDWLAEQLRREYERLSDTAPTLLTPPREGPGDLAQALVDHGRILPLLDGFDELPPALHPVALKALSRELPIDQPLVLASRTAVYRAAVALNPDTGMSVNGAAAIQLLPVEPPHAAAYLRRNGDGRAGHQWDMVIARLGTDTPVGQALSTPLGLFLARTIYAPRPQAASVPEPPHPNELCDITAFPTRAAVYTRLFDAFIPAAYGPDHRRPPRWSAGQAQQALAVLARHLEAHRGGSTDLAWWELGMTVPTVPQYLTAALVTGLFGAVTVGLVVGISFGLVLGLVGMLVAGLVAACASPYGLDSALPGQYPSRRYRSGLMLGLMAALVAALLVYGFAGGRAAQYAGLIAGAAFWSMAGDLTLGRVDLAERVGPGTVMAQDRRNLFQIVLVYPLGFGLLGVFLCGLTSPFPGIPAFGIGGGLAVGLTAGFAYGVAAGYRETAWAAFAVTTTCLTVLNRLPWSLMGPWSLMAFLQDAHEHRGVLRQVGTVYQFRHIDLQRHLAQAQHGSPSGP
ncbi:NACHT domain-containing NTPase [Streptomyces sp. R11]|uniref:NACHT domain-containing NTPase n=1 Tax=Streptomyces sp. R11 TaxID=3238625 RepID=A0AB39MTB8_9ACTN